MSAHISQKNGKQASARVNGSKNSSTKNFEKSPGYEHIRKAEELEKNGKHKFAIKEYEKGLNMLEKETLSINSSAEKKQWKEAIEKLNRHKQSVETSLRKKSLKNINNGGNINNNNNNNNNNSNNNNNNNNNNNSFNNNGHNNVNGAPKKEIEKPEPKPIEQEKGYIIIQQAVKKEEENQFKDAIDLYEEGIDKLTLTLKEMSRKTEIENRRKIIEEYRKKKMNNLYTYKNESQFLTGVS